MPKKPPRDYLDGDIVEKIKRKGPLEMTAEDHSLIGGTPPDKLAENLGKTLGELLSDEEILNLLRDETGVINEFKARKPASAENLIAKFEASLKYLRKIGRLPEEFENYKV